MPKPNCNVRISIGRSSFPMKQLKALLKELGVAYKPTMFPGVVMADIPDAGLLDQIRHSKASFDMVHADMVVFQPTKAQTGPLAWPHLKLLSMGFRLEKMLRRDAYCFVRDESDRPDTQRLRASVWKSSPGYFLVISEYYAAFEADTDFEMFDPIQREGYRGHLPAKSDGGPKFLEQIVNLGVVIGGSSYEQQLPWVEMRREGFRKNPETARLL